MFASRRRFEIYVDERDRVSSVNNTILTSHEDAEQESLVERRGAADLSRSDNASQLALHIKQLRLEERSGDIRVAIAHNSQDCLRPYGTQRFLDDLSSWSYRATSKAPSFVINHNGIKFEGFYHSQDNCITIENLDHDAVECCRVVNCVPDHESDTPIWPGDTQILEVGAWRISHTIDRHKWVDMYVFRRTFEFVEDKSDSAERRVDGFAIQPRRLPLAELKVADGQESYTLNYLSTNEWPTSQMSIRKGNHSKHGLVAVKELLVTQEASIPHVTRRWKRAVDALIKNCRRPLGPHPSIARMVGYDIRRHSIYTKFNYPVLLVRRNSQNFYDGEKSAFFGILKDIPRGLKCVHEELGLTHFNISSCTITYNPNSRRYIIEGFEQSTPEDKDPEAFGASGYAPPESIVFLRAGDLARVRQRKLLQRSDTYALAIVLLYVLGRIPLPEKEPWDQPMTTKDALKSRQYVKQITSWGRKIRGIADVFTKPEEMLLKKMLEILPQNRLSSHNLQERAGDLLVTSSNFSLLDASSMERKCLQLPSQI